MVILLLREADWAMGGAALGLLAALVEMVVGKVGVIIFVIIISFLFLLISYLAKSASETSISTSALTFSSIISQSIPCQPRLPSLRSDKIMLSASDISGEPPP